MVKRYLSIYPKTNFNIVLIEPEIPQNTGNIGRACVGTWSKLHLVGPLGFKIDDKKLRRAGLDYWPELDWKLYPDKASWWKEVPDPKRVFYFTTKTDQALYDVDYQEGDWFVFGKETKGLDEGWLKENWDRAVTIPFPGNVRSYNLSNSVAVALSEGMRQLR